MDIGRTNIFDQPGRIERQRELIARLERDRAYDLVAEAVRFLAKIKQPLVQAGSAWVSV
jgi:hypothetical protein